MSRKAMAVQCAVGLAVRHTCVACTTSLCDICSMGAFLTSGGNSWHGSNLWQMSHRKSRCTGHHSQHSGGHGMIGGISCWSLGSRHHMLVARNASSTCSACTRVRGRSLPGRKLPEIGEPTSENSTTIAYCIGSSGGSHDSTVHNVQSPVVSVSVPS